MASDAAVRSFCSGAPNSTRFFGIVVGSSTSAKNESRSRSSTVGGAADHGLRMLSRMVFTRCGHVLDGDSTRSAASIVSSSNPTAISNSTHAKHATSGSTFRATSERMTPAWCGVRHNRPLSYSDSWHMTADDDRPGCCSTSTFPVWRWP
jgi:hypothetical protein